jgi:hypothetical protein
MNDKMALKDLIDKTIKCVRLDDDNQFIQFDTDDGNFSYITNETCCSESWINHISGIGAIIGEKVFKVDEVEMEEIYEGEKNHSGKQSHDIIYSFKIFTNKGVCEIEMRNPSNGYYGGELISEYYNYHTRKMEPILNRNSPIIEKDF